MYWCACCISFIQTILLILLTYKLLQVRSISEVTKAITLNDLAQFEDGRELDGAQLCARQLAARTATYYTPVKFTIVTIILMHDPSWNSDLDGKGGEALFVV